MLFTRSSHNEEFTKQLMNVINQWEADLQKTREAEEKLEVMKTSSSLMQLKTQLALYLQWDLPWDNLKVQIYNLHYPALSLLLKPIQHEVWLVWRTLFLTRYNTNIAFYHMTRTAPRALSLQNYWENPRMRAVRDGASKAGKSRPDLLGSRTALIRGFYQ